MEIDKDGLASELSLFAVLAFEVLISFITPGLVFLFVLLKLHPQLILLAQQPQQLEKLGLWILLAIAATAGVVLSRLGDWLLGIVARQSGFAAKVDDNFIEEYCNVHVGAHATSIAFQSLSADEQARFKSLSPDKQTEYWDNFISNLRQAVKNDFERKKNLGLSLVPLVVSQLQGLHQKRIRIYLSGPDSIYAFCRAILPIMLFTSVSIYIACSSTMGRVKVSVISLALTLIWINICINSYAFLRGCQLSLWVGLGEQSSLPIKPQKAG